MLIHSLLNKKNLRTALVIFTALLLSCFAYNQYQVYQEDIRITKEQFQLNSLRGRLVYYDEALTLSARSFVATQDPHWQQRYDSIAKDFFLVLSQLYSLLNDPALKGKQELDSSNAHLITMEAQAFALVRAGSVAQARSLLFSSQYEQQKCIYSKALQTFKAFLHLKTDQLIFLHHREAIKNTLVTACIILLILMGWGWFMRISNKSARELELANEQLHLLWAHVEELREKERLATASFINEEVGQQIAALKLKVANVHQTLFDTAHPQAAVLCDVEKKLDYALNYLRNLATQVYPLVLRDLGLVEVLQWESENLSHTSGIKVSFFCEEIDVEVNKKTATLLFRSYQEKLQSLIHLGATEITSCLRFEPDALTLHIYSNVPSASNPQNSFIDIIIKERLMGLKGHLQTLSHADGQTVVLITVPYSIG